jgi:hypothetical protein
MNPVVKERWLAALRSGEYKQGKDFLCKDGCHCCLGVLTDIYLKEHGLEWNTPNEYYVGYHFDGSQGILANKVSDWAGLDDNNPLVFTGDGENLSLSSLNDGEYGDRYSFEEIADLIEKEL